MSPFSTEIAHENAKDAPVEVVGGVMDSQGLESEAVCLICYPHDKATTMFPVCTLQHLCIRPSAIAHRGIVLRVIRVRMLVCKQHTDSVVIGDSCGFDVVRRL